MALNNYAALQTAIASWLNRTDLTAAIKDFITLNEAECNDRLRTSDQVTRATATFNEEYENQPTDCVQIRSLHLDSTNPNERLQYLTPEQFNARNDNLDTGKPQYFTVIGSIIRLLPIPDTDYTGEMVYYASIPALSDSATTNWLLTRAPDVYLYGSLKHSASYLLDDGRKQMWEAEFRTAIERLNNADERKRFPTPIKAMRVG